MSKDKVHLKLGAAEVRLSGDNNNIGESALKILERMLKLSYSKPITAAQKNDTKTNTNDPENSNYDFSIETIATRMSCSKHRDLAKAACFHLALVKNKVEFGRDDILETMKNANSFYNENMRKSLSGTIKSLVRSNVILERSSERFSLAKNGKTEAEKVLATIG